MSKTLVRVLAVVILFLGATSFTLNAGTKSPARDALDAGNPDKTIELLANQADKTAEEFYLLGNAYEAKGERAKAVTAWKDCLQVNKNLPKKKKWTFLFPPGKKLKGVEKKALKDEFEEKYTSLAASVVKGKLDTAKDLERSASRKKIEATRLNKKADAKSEAISDKIKLATRGGSRRTPAATTTGKTTTAKGGKGGIGGMIVFGIIAVVIIAIIVLAIIFGRGGGGGRVRHGGGRSGALDREILNDIDEREDMRMAAADMEADAALDQLEAQEAREDAEEITNSAALFEGDADFTDDDAGGDDEFEDDEGFEDDEEE